ncbi:MAG: M15 family metallopeptidase [Alphaproteobacteria bacterium]
MSIKKISPDDLVCMNLHESAFPYRIDLAYAKDNNLLLGERIYRKNAKLWLHKDLADIVFKASKICFTQHQLHFILYDGLRTSDAQEAMMHTRNVRNNPQWLEPPRLLSPPGSGAHPRAMAIDIGLETQSGKIIDMGCPFDYLARNPHPDHNPAHRLYKHPANILKNREMLDTPMIDSSIALNTPILPLPQEWWDFRLPADIYDQYEPLSEKDLPSQMKLLSI